MPYLYVRIAGDADPALAERIATDLLAITSSVLGKREAVTSISVDFVPIRCGFIGDRAGRREPANLHLNIKITEARIPRTKSRLGRRQGVRRDAGLDRSLAAASYIVIDDVRADAGFEANAVICYIAAKTL